VIRSASYNNNNIILLFITCAVSLLQGTLAPRRRWVFRCYIIITTSSVVAMTAAADLKESKKNGRACVRITIYVLQYINIYIYYLFVFPKTGPRNFYLSSHRAGLNYFSNPPPAAVAHRRQVHALAHTDTHTFLYGRLYIYIYMH